MNINEFFALSSTEKEQIVEAYLKQQQVRRLIEDTKRQCFEEIKTIQLTLCQHPQATSFNKWTNKTYAEYTCPDCEFTWTTVTNV